MNVLQTNTNNGFWARLRRLPRGWIGAVLIGLVLLGAIFAPQIAPTDPTFQFHDGLAADGSPLPPSARFALGTDNLGREVLSRVLYGAQVSLFVAITANVTAAILGTIAGLAAGYFSGFVDTLLMRFTDILLAFPAILLALGLSAMLRPSFGVVTIIVTVIAWPGLARVVRSQVLVVRERAFIESARAVGAGDLYIIVRHILPHIITITVIWATLSLASTVLIEASLSYLGLGIPPPTASWGNMIADGQTYYRNAPWLIVVPGVAIMLTTLGFNLLGDAMRDALDPRTMQR